MTCICCTPLIRPIGKKYESEHPLRADDMDEEFNARPSPKLEDFKNRRDFDVIYDLWRDEFPLREAKEIARRNERRQRIQKARNLF